MEIFLEAGYSTSDRCRVLTSSTGAAGPGSSAREASRLKGLLDAILPYSPLDPIQSD